MTHKELVIQEALEHIALRLNPDEIIDILGISSEQLVTCLSDEIVGNLYKFRDVLDEEIEEEDYDEGSSQEYD